MAAYFERYVCNGEWTVNEELGKYYTYGIKSSCGTVSVRDVSTCGAAVEEMTALMNNHQASPIHVRDIIEDMLL